MELFHPMAQFSANDGVQRAKGLVEQEHPRLDRQSPRKRHSLSLAPRELGRVVLGLVFQFHQRQQLFHTGVDLLGGSLAHLEPEAHVLRDVHVTKRRVVLKTETNVAVARVDVGHVLAVDDDTSLVGPLESADEFQQRRLARARWPEHRRQRAVDDLGADVLDGVGRAVVLGEVLKRDRHAAVALFAVVGPVLRAPPSTSSPAPTHLSTNRARQNADPSCRKCRSARSG